MASSRSDERVIMKLGFCGECCYLSITEKEQNEIRPKPEHICNKYNLTHSPR